MPKQHELLAVRDSARGQSEKVRTGLIHTFQNKRHLFEEKVTTFTPNAEGAASRTESQTLIQSTIVKELEWLTPIVAGALNVEVAIELGNTRSVGDIILESGAVVAKGVPATALLIMSKRLSEIKQLVEAIPTLDPAKSFQLDADKGEGVYQAREIVKNRTSKEQTPIVLYPATPEHPAQTQLITKDVVIGTIRELEWSGLLTPAAKADMISRVEELIRAVAAALSRANDVEVNEKPTLGNVMLGYVFGNVSLG